MITPFIPLCFTKMQVWRLSISTISFQTKSNWLIYSRMAWLSWKKVLLSYLNILPYSLWCYLSRLEGPVLPLRIQTGHYARNNVPREHRYCLCCNSIANIEDEFHVVFINPSYTALRNKYIPLYYTNRPSMFNFLEHLNVTMNNILLSVSKCVMEMILLRNSILFNQCSSPNVNSCADSFLYFPFCFLPKLFPFLCVCSLWSYCLFVYI